MTENRFRCPECGNLISLSPHTDIEYGHERGRWPWPGPALFATAHVCRSDREASGENARRWSMNEDDAASFFQAFGKVFVVLAACILMGLVLAWGILALLEHFGVLMLFVALPA